MGLDNDEPVASDEEIAIIRRIRAQREGKHVLDPNPLMGSRVEPLCRCPPNHCLLHPTWAACSLGKGQESEQSNYQSMFTDTNVGDD